MDEEIARATSSTNLDQFIKLIEERDFVNVFDNCGNGPFHYAVARNDAAVLDYLIVRQRKYINTENFLGQSPLFQAVIEGCYGLAEKLVLAGAEVDITDDSEISPSLLHMTTRAITFSELLIQNGADVNSMDEECETPLHYAVEIEIVEAIHMLLFYNADTTMRNDLNYTPFMMALEMRHFVMQEALFEYLDVDDYDCITLTDDGELSLLGMALLYNSPFSKEMILRGADVNSVSRYFNGVLFLVLCRPREWGPFDLDTFELIWKKMDYEPAATPSVLGNLFLLETEEFHKIIDIFLGNEEKFPALAESVGIADDFNVFIEYSRDHRLPLKKFSELFCILMTYGYTPSEKDLAIIFHTWGYCEIFETVFHMEIRGDPSLSPVEAVIVNLLCGVGFSTRELLDKLASVVEEESASPSTVLAIIRVLDYFVHPSLTRAYSGLRRTDCVTLKIGGLPKVPSLLELARNQTREHIIKTYNVTDGCQLYTLINALDISDTFKELLTFKTVTYQPEFSPVSFQRYVKLLKMVQVNNIYERI